MLWVSGYQSGGASSVAEIAWQSRLIACAAVLQVRGALHAVNCPCLSRARPCWPPAALPLASCMPRCQSLSCLLTLLSILRRQPFFEAPCFGEGAGNTESLFDSNNGDKGVSALNLASTFAAARLAMIVGVVWCVPVCSLPDHHVGGQEL